jgi:hypothetical protein
MSCLKGGGGEPLEIVESLMIFNLVLPVGRRMSVMESRTYA